jgi:hypothetical protein
MFVLQNLRDFMDNPMGKGSNAIPSRNLVKEDLNRRFDALMSHEGKKMSLEIFKDKNEDNYFFHLKVPSESKTQKHYYDVIIQFTTDGDKELRQDKNLNRYLVKFFSNSPSFTYTYAYAFKMYGALADGLDDKFRDIVFDQPPMTRNPGSIISYEKTTYFAALYLLRDANKLLSKLIINTMAKPYDKGTFQEGVRNTDKAEFDAKAEKSKDRQKSDVSEEEPLGRATPRSDRTVSSKQGSKIGGSKLLNKIKPRAKIKPRKSSITKIKPR